MSLLMPPARTVSWTWLLVHTIFCWKGLRLIVLRIGTYYIRAMLKEYAFEPASQTVVLAAAETKTATFSTRRNAYRYLSNLWVLMSVVLTSLAFAACLVLSGQ
jgi:hypothetical protein